MKDGSKADGGVVLQWDCHGGLDQHWRKVQRTDGYFSLENRNSRKCLNLTYGKKDNGAPIDQFICGATNPTQLFKHLDATSAGLFPVDAVETLVDRNIKPVHSGKCLDVVSARAENGANVQQWDCHGGTNQKWELVPDGKHHQIKVLHSGKCLDVVVASKDNGANVQQWDCHGGTNQKWELVPDGKNFQIKAVHSGKCLDVVVASKDNGANIQQWDCHGGTNQMWEILPGG